jgi:uncharacterized protein YprB with RNaseH-like and TPR domain
MTTELFNKNQDKLIFLDIETVRGVDKFNKDSHLFDLFRYKNRDRTTMKLPTIAETIKLYKNKAALNPIYGKVVVVTMAFIHDEKIYLKTIKGHDEKKILKETVDILNNNSGKDIVIWNKDFDLPFLRKRFVINGLEGYLSDSMGNDSMKKPWTLKGVLDLMEVWRGISFYNDSLEEVSVALGLDSPKDKMNGAEVSDYYYSGKLDDIAKYCEKDVVSLVNIYRKFVNKPIITDILIKTSDENEKTGIIDKIKNEGRYTSIHEKEILSIIKDFSKKEKCDTVEIINAALSLNKNKLTEKQIKKICS